MTNHLRICPALNISTQNVQSLNISTLCKKTLQKICSITRELDDIILLSDIRLNSDKQATAIEDIRKRFKFRGYDLYFNSRKNSRGTGILISTKLRYVVHDIFRDVDDNIILLDTTISDKKITIGSIYGPNTDDETFFRTLTNTCIRFNNPCTIIGGDWNCTYDVRGVHNNIDTLNIADIPSKRRSKWLQDLCTSLKLSDPYRFFYPERREFTYIYSECYRE
jgi:hypothetical protein